MHNHNICFTGSGHHYPWQVGVALYLQQTYNLEDCSFTGVSAGSFVASLLSMEVDIADVLAKWVKDLYKIFSLSLTGCYTVYHDALKTVASRYLKEDSYKKANGRLFVSITKVGRGGLKNEIVNAFNSNSDVYDASCASTHIPFITSLSLFYMFRNSRCIDGGLSYNFVKLKENTIFISPYKWNSWKRYTYALTGLLANSEKQYHSLVMQGYVDAKNNDIEFIKLGLTKKSS